MAAAELEHRSVAPALLTVNWAACKLYSSSAVSATPTAAHRTPPGHWSAGMAAGVQVLSADWCKYNPCVIATGSVDKSIKVRQWEGSKVWVSVHAGARMCVLKKVQSGVGC